MDRGIDDNALLEFVEFRILPDLNRYRAFAGFGDKDALLIEGELEQLTQHLPKIKDFCDGGSESNVKLQWPRSSSPTAWFSKSTFRRFLSITGNSTVVFNEIKAIEDEMSQLETARKFHLSLHSQSESKVEVISSDPSKNELLRALDSRLKALREELTTSLEKAAGSFCSTKDISHMVNCCHSLGALALEKYLIKYSELNQITLTLNNPSDEKAAFINAGKCDDGTITVANGVDSMQSQPVFHVQYGVSPAKAAKAERDSASDSEDSSDESVANAAERSRSITRSATPRRSASPMRRLQIARVGSRRAPAIAIMSLNNLPIRERTSNTVEDELSNNSDEEVSEKMPRKTETNEQRISVQAAISLFEKKQREDNIDVRKKSLRDVPKNVKPVLRKWNSCGGQSHVQHSAEIVTENHSFSLAANQQDVETQKVYKQEADTPNVDVTHQAGQLDAALLTRNSLESSTPDTPGSGMATQVTDSTERLTASAKWNQQKEAELNMLMKMIEEKPTKQRRSIASKRNSSEQKGGFSDDYKKKRDEKLRGESAEKLAEKESHLKAMQQIIEKSNGDMLSKPDRRHSLGKRISSGAPQQSGKLKEKSPKDTKSATAKRTVKPSSLPATRKSWPSIPPLQATGTSPMAVSYKKVTSSTVPSKGSKSQPSQLLAHPNPKPEKTLPQKSANELKTKSKKSSKGAVVVHQQPWARDTKPTKPISLASSEDFSGMAPVKTKLPTKGAKGSSVTPVESNPFLRKGSKVGSAVVPAGSKSKSSPRLKEAVRKSENTPVSQEKEMAVQSPEQVDKHEIKNLVNDRTAPALVSEIPERSEQKIMEPETYLKDNADGSANLAMVEDPSLAFNKEEPTIPPSAWVEELESQDPPIMPIPIDDNEVQFAYPTTVTSVETKSPRMRQSLSKMLQEETNELESTEWGNAEHSSVICSKDAPKGFKRLLKFARKSKGDANSSGWSSSSVFSEGDDDADDYKAAFQRNTDNQLRKANYHTKSTSQLKPLGEGPDRKYSSHNQTHETSNGASISSYRAGEVRSSVGVSGTKSSRSFFSLSAFRGSK